MIIVRAAMAAAVIALLSVVIAGSAGARTPTPAATQEPMPTPGVTPVHDSTATPVAPEPAVFAVMPWVNARNTASEVTAFVGTTFCATGLPTPLVVDPSWAGSRAIFTVTVPSEEVVPGCGREGAVVTFLVDGEQAPQTALWHARPFKGHFVSVNVIIGFPFARFSAVSSVLLLQPYGRDVRLVPYITDRACGDAEAVFSNEQEPGCGFEGAQVTFKLLDAQGNVVAVANEKLTWHAWDGVAGPQQIDLTFGPPGGIAMPGTGVGPQRTTAQWGHLALALASLGLTGGVAALALRRRPTR